MRFENRTTEDANQLEQVADDFRVTMPGHLKSRTNFSKGSECGLATRLEESAFFVSNSPKTFLGSSA